MKRLLLKSLALLVLASPVVAEEDLMAIDISAQDLELQQRKGYAVFKGEVKVTHGAMKLGSETLEVFYATEKDESESEIQKIIANKKVTLVYGQDTATGERAEYNPGTGSIAITGNVVMIRDGNVLKGEKLSYDTKTRQMKLDGGAENGGRVKATFSIKKAP